MKPSARDLMNVDRMAAQMDARGVDAVVARAGINLAYLAGFAFPGTLARHVDLVDSPRAVYLVWPRTGEPRIIANTIAAPLAQRDSWIEAFDLYEGYREKPVEALIKTLTAMGLRSATVAFETEYTNAADWESLRTQLPRMQMVDSSELMEQVRAIKTPAEIARLREGARVLDHAFLKHFATARPGMRERDLHGAIVAECIAGGSEFTHGILNSSRNTLPYGGESDFVFQAGDAIRTDYVAYFKGYPGHQSRCAVIGQPTPEQTRDYHVIRDIYRAVNEQLLPGRTAGEIYQFAKDQFAAAGTSYSSIIAGHSVGCWWHQQEPVIARGNPRRLESGMVIAMEPFVNHWHIQDMLLITDHGPELLSPDFNTDEIFACG
ncbi:M24 family metallopeptidase [Acidisoma silvae]|uniref:Aminopeptidase P family protein n=1 Tax=Acidisoma silvae TaxID=2802396 RepID=A0A963YWI5_9PROT|nr:Xaa-Pro peptidase family protein [Acidisoma silvae]MCB8878139.1 aminopeptidase P family protein [Acidisoma silvae]